jgi:hypothetical protein
MSSRNSATGNIFNQLKSLITDTTTTVGVSQGDNLDGTTNVLLVGSGDIIKVSGSGHANGVSVFITNGTITGRAPTITPIVIDV